MLYDVDTDIDIAFINGDFSAPAGWDITGPWTIAGGKAILNRVGPVFDTLRQFNMPVLKGNVYRITFEVLVADFINEPAAGLLAGLGAFENPPISTVGIFQFDTQWIYEFPTFAFTTENLADGDYAEIDWVTIEALGPYVTYELDINWPKPRLTDFNTGILSEFWQHLSSVNGETSCLIGYDK